MFRYHIRGENIEVTEAIREYIEKKVSKLERYFDPVPEANVNVNLKVYTDKTAKVEVTIPLPHLVLRAEETSQDLYASVDLVVDKLERQLRKFKTKLVRKSREQSAQFNAEVFTLADYETDEEQTSEFDIVRTKRLALKPMSCEEAILQMNLLGHSFFIFEDADTGSINIVYHRKDGKYGLIETDN